MLYVIGSVSGSDSGIYTCEATLSDGLGSVQTGITQLAVVTKPSVPALSDENAPPAGYIGVNYSWPLPYSKLITNTPTSFLITGLPPGLTYNTVTGVVSGKPTKVGSYTITAIAKNVAGNSTPTQTAVLTISPLPAATIGTVVATIGASTPINGNKGGRLDLTVLDTGSYSAKLILGKDTLSAAGTLGVGSGLFDVNTLSYQSRITIPRKGLPSLILAFEVDASAGYVSGVLSDGTNSVAISGIRQFWDALLNPCVYGADATTKSLSYNLGLNLSHADVGMITKPQGSGYLNMVLSTAGKATFSGRLSDGTTITGRRSPDLPNALRQHRFFARHHRHRRHQAECQRRWKAAGGRPGALDQRFAGSHRAQLSSRHSRDLPRHPRHQLLRPHIPDPHCSRPAGCD
jgi:hypothetical protein